MGRLAGVKRALCGRSGAAHVGMLQIYRLEAATQPAGARPRLLFPSGLPSVAAAAATLAEVAARGETVLLTEQVLGQLLGADPAAFTRQLGGSSREKTGALGPGSADRRNGALDAVAPVASADDVGSALVAAGPSTPLCLALAEAAAEAEPDWSSTAQPTHTTAEPSPPPSPREKELLAAAADGDTARLRAILHGKAGGGAGGKASAGSAARILLASARLPPSGASALHLASASGASEAVDQV